MENVLLIKGIILQSGEVNKDKVNLGVDKRASKENRAQKSPLHGIYANDFFDFRFYEESAHGNLVLPVQTYYKH